MECSVALCYLLEMNGKSGYKDRGFTMSTTLTLSMERIQNPTVITTGSWTKSEIETSEKLLKIHYLWKKWKNVNEEWLREGDDK